MEKHPYYVNVASNEILPEPGDTGTPFEIEATENELAELQSLFDRRDDEEQHSLVRTLTPYERFDTLETDQDERSEPFDETMHDIYQKIYELGTPQTRGQIVQMGVL
jgi:hypothetical protein